ncbi:hypothetical protein E2562_018949 [Oryza meyeriana var. granulata]|uniref:Uncharacterized protein n=1 Tax=Oryza meyeriana var. granulata TaxID=110450 RepID=A0A6G1DJT6_9ORYZ|nr:hypothetical protein E2562_018949 [Oryza meyeriana var. granulata]
MCGHAHADSNGSNQGERMTRKPKQIDDQQENGEQNEKSEEIEDAGYEVALYGKTMKGKQCSAAMDNMVVKGKQRAYHRWTKCGGEEQVKD